MSDLYDLLSLGAVHGDVVAWLAGQVVDGLPRPPSPRERRRLAEDWRFWARPGQRWQPGPEEITVCEGGRGSGKSWLARNAVFEAALDPERWGGYAVVAGVDPQGVEADMLHGLSGIVSCGRRAVAVGLVPDFTYNPSKQRITYRAPRGGGVGLTVLVRASSKPQGGRGPNVGLAWLDEFGVWYHRERDEQGTNLWQALRPAIRAGNPDSKIVVTMTPSRAPEVRALQADAERPECPACRAAHVEREGPWRGAPWSEPWRLPRSPQRRLHPLLDTRETEVVRRCPACGGEVVAPVRTVFFATTDNPMTDTKSRLRAVAALQAGTVGARQEFAPAGEADSGARGTLVRDEHVRRVVVDPGDAALDRWSQALAHLGVAPADVLVAVDPAVTSGEGSDESGVVAVALRRGVPWPAVADRSGGANGDQHGLAVDQAVALQDDSVRPDEVEPGASPSSVWAPRALWLALLWGAPRVVVETNQGGDEVLALMRDLCRRPPTEREVLERLRREFPGVADARLAVVVRRVLRHARVGAVVVEPRSRVADKTSRWAWYGETAARGQQAVLCVPWLGGARHWQVGLAQATGFEPAPDGRRLTRARRDRWDAVVSAAEDLLGVVEHRTRGVAPAGPGWMADADVGTLL